jgi:mono/diheme cytochrome c family protein
MIANIISMLVLIALVVLFAWLVKRAWGSKHWFVKWPGVVLSGLLTLILAAATGVAGIGFYKLNAPQSNPVPNIKVAGTPEQIARGQKLAAICVGCHASAGKPPLDGSPGNFVEGGPPVGTLYAPNLTPGGETQGWSDGELIRAIREGVHQDGHPLIIMPTDAFNNLSDADVQALVAYLRSQPAVKRDLPARDLNLLAALFVGAGLFPTSVKPPITQPVAAPPAGATADYGKYLVAIGGCRDCHGADLAGGQAAGGLGPPVGPNLTLVVPKWSEADFIQTIRTGVAPGGHALSDDMPWKDVSNFSTDDDLGAIYAYLHNLPPTMPAAQ